MQHLTPARFSNGCRAAATIWLLITLAGLLASDIPSIAQEPAGGNHRPANRLAQETSPYLLLHAHNPVDWYPWGPEAFARAKAEKKPIFLSIGYSSCYWCHVMERESFMDPEIARFLNEHFVSIKVDREERPDVDQVYMAALQAFSTGGWPMSMFLLPDGRPFYGETYLPPRDRQGISGFLTVLRGIVKAWREERGEIERAADGLTEIVRRKLGSSGSRRKPALDSARSPPPAALRWPNSSIPSLEVSASTCRTRAGPSFQSPSTWSFCWIRSAATVASKESPGTARVRRLRRRLARSSRGEPTRSSWCCSRSTGWRGGHSRSARRGLSPLCDQSLLDRSALREDAL